MALTRSKDDFGRDHIDSVEPCNRIILLKLSIKTIRTEEEEEEEDKKRDYLKKDIIESITDHFDKCKSPVTNPKSPTCLDRKTFIVVYWKKSEIGRKVH